MPSWVHVHVRLSVLCCQRISLRKRWMRLRETVFRTILFGSGAWKCSKFLMDKLQATDTKMLDLTMCRKPRADESDSEFWTRLQANISLLKISFGWVSLVELAINQYYAWWGHVARMAPCPVSNILHWRGDERFKKAVDTSKVHEVLFSSCAWRPTVC
jgi:hypothetical protein